jgi:hypothetical protein
VNTGTGRGARPGWTNLQHDHGAEFNREATRDQAVYAVVDAGVGYVISTLVVMPWAILADTFLKHRSRVELDDIALTG